MDSCTCCLLGDHERVLGQNGRSSDCVLARDQNVPAATSLCGANAWMHRAHGQRANLNSQRQSHARCVHYRCCLSMGVPSQHVLALAVRLANALRELFVPDDMRWMVHRHIAWPWKHRFVHCALARRLCPVPVRHRLVCSCHGSRQRGPQRGQDAARRARRPHRIHHAHSPRRVCVCRHGDRCVARRVPRVLRNL
eukprot:Amastigsp_a508543_33.p3 type:complete len:195 gc:universal Amastigsp_a508543_33:1247-663(-)